MKMKYFYGLTAALAAPAAFSQIVINEIDSDTPSSDTAEFVELYNAGSEAVALTGHALVFFNGSNDSEYQTVDLGAASIAAGDFLVIGNAAVPNVDIVIPDGSIQNGPDGVGLYNGATAAAYIAETETAPLGGADLVDALVYGASDPDATGLLTALGETTQYDESANSLHTVESIQRNPDGSETFETKEPTPGETNFTLPKLTLTLDPSSVSEGDGEGVIFGEIIVPEPVVGDLVITIGISDVTELDGPTTVTIVDGDDFVAFELDAVDDMDIDGLQTVVVTASASGYQDGTVDVFVADDDLELPEIVINEMQVKAGGDDPQFVELYNNQGTAVDLAGWSVKAYGSDTGDTVNFGNLLGSFTIPSGSPVLLAPGEFYLAGDSVFESIYGITPDLQVEPGFGLFDITMILFDADDNAVFTVFSQDDDATNQANNAGAPTVADITINDGFNSPAGYYLDSDGGTTASLIEFAPQPASSATPGQTNGVFIDRLRIELDTTFFSEADGAGVATATVTRVNNSTDPLTVTLSSADPTEVVFQSATLSFAAGEEELTVMLDAVDDMDEDGLQEVLLTASATGFEDGTATVSVADDESTIGASDVLITQYSEGTSFNKFIELTNVGSSSITLAGWQLTLWANGNRESWKTATGGSSSAFDLSEVTLAAGESFVVAHGSADTPAGVADVTDSGVANFNGDDSVVLYSGALNPSNIADAVSLAASDASNKSLVRLSLDTGWDLVAASSFLDYPSVWGEIDLATVEAAVDGDTNYLGYFEVTEPSDYIVAISDCSYSAGQFVINFTASGSSDIYVSTDLTTWGEATNGAGVASGTYTDTAPPAGKAFYLIQEAGTPAPE
ncbi:lamin tail domain-containing protein [Roseibacillus persicicus]|uniref:LTD domain-containing protein n=2 Tax=Roseibacillus persicicus TaxID=454148 RepID=A0A918TKA9_9BACT|nr:lamin tail domain-containing protein [Roseibacillus persicicus]GHC50980.1 hypothetical protein GCM10007100_16440 [Roseibacillus persicicus]